MKKVSRMRGEKRERKKELRKESMTKKVLRKRGEKRKRMKELKRESMI